MNTSLARARGSRLEILARVQHGRQARLNTGNCSNYLEKKKHFFLSPAKMRKNASKSGSLAIFATLCVQTFSMPCVRKQEDEERRPAAHFPVSSPLPPPSLSRATTTRKFFFLFSLSISVALQTQFTTGYLTL